MKLNRLTALILALVLTLSLFGCRSRSANQPQPSEPVPEESAPVIAPTPQPTEEAIEPDQPDAPTTENPESDRLEYNSDADAQVTDSAEPVLTQPEPEATPIPTETPEHVGTVTETGDHTATETLPAEEASQQGASESGEIANDVQTYYQVLLISRFMSLFECEKLYIYWETEDDYSTVYKISPEHQLMIGAGGYDVASKLLEGNLLVDDEWIGRKNPDVIVKMVAPSVLGNGVQSTTAAQSIKNSLLTRPDWDVTGAVKNNRVILLSSELMDTVGGQTALMVYLGKLMYPAQMSDVNADDALHQLLREAYGHDVSGIYAY